MLKVRVSYLPPEEKNRALFMKYTYLLDWIGKEGDSTIDIHILPSLPFMTQHHTDVFIRSMSTNVHTINVVLFWMKRRYQSSCEDEENLRPPEFSRNVFQNILCVLASKVNFRLFCTRIKAVHTSLILINNLSTLSLLLQKRKVKDTFLW